MSVLSYICQVKTSGIDIHVQVPAGRRIDAEVSFIHFLVP